MQHVRLRYGANGGGVQIDNAVLTGIGARAVDGALAFAVKKMISLLSYLVDFDLFWFTIQQLNAFKLVNNRM